MEEGIVVSCIYKDTLVVDAEHHDMIISVPDWIQFSLGIILYSDTDLSPALYVPYPFAIFMVLNHL